MSTIPLSEAKVRFSEIADEVERIPVRPHHPQHHDLQRQKQPNMITRQLV